MVIFLEYFWRVYTDTGYSVYLTVPRLAQKASSVLSPAIFESAYPLSYA